MSGMEEEKKGEIEKEETGKGTKMDRRERVIKYPTFSQSDANGLHLPPTPLLPTQCTC